VLETATADAAPARNCRRVVFMELSPEKCAVSVPGRSMTASKFQSGGNHMRLRAGWRDGFTEVTEDFNVAFDGLTN